MSLNTFTNEQLVSWVETNIPGNQNVKAPIIEAIQNNGLTGDDVSQFTSHNDFSELGDNVTAFMARRVFNKLQAEFPRDFAPSQPQQQPQQQPQPQAQQPQQNQQQDQQQQQRRQEQARAADLSIEERIRLNAARRANRPRVGLNNGGNNNNINNNNNNNNNNNGNNNDEYRFQVSIFVGNTRKKTRNFFTARQTVMDLKIEIANNEAGGRAEDVRLSFLGRPLVDTNTLEQSGIVGSQCFVLVVIRVHGGAQALVVTNDEKQNGSNTNKLVWNNEQTELRERLPDWDNKNIKPTDEPDCLTLDDNKEELRVKMPCSHVFAPITIFKWCERIINVYSKSSVHCPIPECDKEWKIQDIVSGADLSDDEYGSLMRILSHRQLMDSGEYKECPYCNSLVDIPDKVYTFRVRCGNNSCNKGDFCWICGQKWIGSGFAVCGNNNCHTSKVNNELKIENCGTTTAVSSRSDVNCPKIRACPRCLSIVEYKQACKHMQCWQCKKGFCFICLALQKDGKWECKTGNSYDGKCELAPVQVIS